MKTSPKMPVVPFFLISHGFSWTCWTTTMLVAGADVWSSPARWLVYVGGVGPLLAGVWMTWQTGGSAGLRRLVRRVTDPRLIPGRWLATVLLLPVVAMAAALGVAWLGGALPEAVDASRLMTLVGNPAALLSFAAFVLIFGPLPEEIGWRGYGLDALQARVSALSASLLLGLAWALWHAPLFFIAGYFGDGGSPEPILFTTAILVNSVLYTVIHNHTGRSVLAAILFHFMINFVGMLVEGAAWVEWTRTAVTAVAALVAVAVFGGHTLGRSRGLMTALVVTLVVGACSRSDAPVAGEPVDAFAAHIDRRVPQLMQQYDVPGLAVVLVHEGSPVWSGAYGYADVARGTEMTTDAVFRAESISKAVTAWGVLRLVESGQIRLDDDVRPYVVDLMPHEGYAGRPVTIRRLLSHNAGMPLGPVGPPVQFAPGSSMPDLRSYLAPYAHPVKEPGSGFMYSNVGFNLLELVVEEVTGRDFADYIRDEVLLPLGMQSSGFQWQAELQRGMATGYDLRNRAVPPYVYPARASGGLLTTVHDVALFVAAGMPGHYSGDAAVLGAGAVRMLHTPAVPAAGIFSLVADDYGLGHFLETLPDGRQAVWVGGQGNGWMSDFHSVPETGAALVILANSQRSWPLMSSILADWARWSGAGTVKWARIAHGVTALRVLTALIVMAALWQAYRIVLGVRRGKRFWAPLSTSRLPQRMLQVAAALAVFATLAWAAAQPYLMISSVFPGADRQAWWALLVLAAVLLASALVPPISAERQRRPPTRALV